MDRRTFLASGGAALGAGVLLGRDLLSEARAEDSSLDLQPEQVCADPNEQITLFARRIGKNRIGYGRTEDTCRSPGPTLVLPEGACVHVNLVNDTDARLSLHFHGVSYTVASDGTPLNDSCVKPGESRTYVISTHAPAIRADGTMKPGSAGYWHYHDHCRGTPHGTGGINAGAWGGLIVRRAGDPEPVRRPYVLVMKDQTFNLRRAPRTPVLNANLGERVEFLVITHGDLFHTFHLHGHRWTDNRTGFSAGASDPSRVIDTKTVGPADSFGFQVIAGEDVGPGAWMYHCHVQGHSDSGMAGLFVVRDPSGEPTEQTVAALQRWETQHPAGRH